MLSSSVYKINSKLPKNVLMLKSTNEVINVENFDNKWRLWYIKKMKALMLMNEASDSSIRGSNTLVKSELWYSNSDINSWCSEYNSCRMEL